RPRSAPSPTSRRRTRPPASSGDSRRSRSSTAPQRPTSSAESVALGVVAPLRLHGRLEIAQRLQLLRAGLLEALGLLAALPRAPLLPPSAQRSHGNRSDVRSAAMLRRAASAWSTITVSATGTSSR